MMQKIVLGGVAFIVFLLLASCPAFGSIEVTSDAVYDSSGNNSYPGEEILISTIINPGNHQITDIEIEILSGEGALIDHGPRSFEESSIPAGSVNLQQEENNNARTYTCDLLEPEQELSLKFRAYPKTLQEESIEVSKMTISYTQLGERLYKKITIDVDTSESSWHAVDAAEIRAEEAEKRADEAEREASIAEEDLGSVVSTSNKYLYIIIGIIMIVIAAVIYKNRDPF